MSALATALAESLTPTQRIVLGKASFAPLISHAPGRWSMGERPGTITISRQSFSASIVQQLERNGLLKRVKIDPTLARSVHRYEITDLGRKAVQLLGLDT